MAAWSSRRVVVRSVGGWSASAGPFGGCSQPRTGLLGPFQSAEWGVAARAATHARTANATTLALEERHLLAGSLHERVESDVGLEVADIKQIARQKRTHVIPLDDVPVVPGDRLAQERRSLELVANELGPLGGNDQEANQRVTRRDPAVATQQRIAEHRGPLDFEQEGDPAADVPDAVDVGDLVGGPADHAERRPCLAIVEPVGETPRAQPSNLLALADPGTHPQAVTAVDQGGDHLAVLLGAAEELVGGEEVVCGAGEAAVAPQAGPDERLVRQVVTGEERRHPLEERRLGQRAGGREE